MYGNLHFIDLDQTNWNNTEFYRLLSNSDVVFAIDVYSLRSFGAKYLIKLQKKKHFRSAAIYSYYHGPPLDPGPAPALNKDLMCPNHLSDRSEQ